MRCVDYDNSQEIDKKALGKVIFKSLSQKNKKARCQKVKVLPSGIDRKIIRLRNISGKVQSPKTFIRIKCINNKTIIFCMNKIYELYVE